MAKGDIQPSPQQVLWPVCTVQEDAARYDHFCALTSSEQDSWSKTSVLKFLVTVAYAGPHTVEAKWHRCDPEYSPAWKSSDGSCNTFTSTVHVCTLNVQLRAAPLVKEWLHPHKKLHQFLLLSTSRVMSCFVKHTTKPYIGSHHTSLIIAQDVVADHI